LEFSWNFNGFLLLLAKIRLQSFVDEGEREMMHEQIIILQDKVFRCEHIWILFGVDSNDVNMLLH